MNKDPKWDTVLKCRKCKIKAEAKKLDDTVTLIRCPRCGTEIAGEHANEMYQKQLIYFAAKNSYDQLVGESNLPLKPGPALIEPDWEFFVDGKRVEE